MSQENVESMRRAIERFKRGGEDDALLADSYDSDAVFNSRADGPDASIYRGHDACRAFVQGRYEDFEERSFDATELIDAPPNAVVAVGRMRGTGRASGVAVEADSVTLWTLRDEKVSNIKLYKTRDAALEVVGL